jgi:hypothetical protein
MNASKGRKKVIADVKQKISSGIFDVTAKMLREKYVIPLEGYPNDTKLVWDPSFTNILSLPSEWIYLGDKKKLHSLLKQIAKIREEHFLEHDFWVVVLLDYIFFNKLNNEVISEWSDNLCTITDVVSEAEIYDDRKISANKKEKWIKSHNDMMDRLFPISIRISPYASINDIKDYINSRSSSIQNSQKRFKRDHISLGKTRTRSTSQRDKFIMEHESMPRKELAKLLNNAGVFGINKYDEQNVNDIISKIKKSRKN